MENKDSVITTGELWVRLFRSPTPERFLAEQSEELPSFSDYITELCRARDEKPEQVLRRSNVESSFGHKLFSGVRKPSRDTVLQLAFGFDMDVEETQQLLKVARASQLHPKVHRDAVIAWCLSRHCTLIDTQEHLYDSGLPIIGG